MTHFKLFTPRKKATFFSISPLGINISSCFSFSSSSCSSLLFPFSSFFCSPHLSPPVYQLPLSPPSHSCHPLLFLLFSSIPSPLFLLLLLFFILLLLHFVLPIHFFLPVPLPSLVTLFSCHILLLFCLPLDLNRVADDGENLGVMDDMVKCFLFAQECLPSPFVIST